MCCLYKIPSLQSSRVAILFSQLIEHGHTSSFVKHTQPHTVSHTAILTDFCLLVFLWWDKNYPTKKNCTSAQSEQFLFKPLLHFKKKKNQPGKNFSGILLIMRFKARCAGEKWNTDSLPPYHTENVILCFTQLFMCPLKQIQSKQFFTGMQEG